MVSVSEPGMSEPGVSEPGDGGQPAPPTSSPDSSSASWVFVLLEVMRDPQSGAQARQDVAHLLHCLVDAGAWEEQT